MDATTVRRRLGLTADHDAFLTRLAALAPSPASLPPPDETAALLNRLGVPAVDAAEAVPALPDPDRDPALWWLLERCRTLITGDLGGYRVEQFWPPLPATLGAPGRWFYLAVLLSAVPDIRRFHAERGVPDEVSWATLADVGVKVARHRPWRGTPGLDVPEWLSLHFRGVLYQLGRLQFNLGEIGPDTINPVAASLDMVREGTGGLSAGTRVLATHIPATGPLTPDACDASFARARPFFARTLGADCAIATCVSWLLDDQLAEYLPAGSNLVRFQRRFRTVDSWEDDAAILRFVFGHVGPTPDPDTLPRRSTLERAVVEHLRAGRHWRVRAGWLEL